MRINRSFLAALLLGILVASSASGAFVAIYGGPTYNATTQSGYQNPYLPVAPGFTAGNGAATGYAEKYTGGTDLGARAFRWNSSGGAAVEFANLGTSSNGSTNTQAYAINTIGNAVGWAEKYLGGTYRGYRAVRWNASGTATELGNLGTDSNSFTGSQAYAINTTAAVGWSYKYIGSTYVGSRAVRWSVLGTPAFELPNIGTDSNGYTTGQAYAVNKSGAAVGSMEKYNGGGGDLGLRAVRWDASTAATELGNLGTDSNGVATNNYAVAINVAGVAVGYAPKYTGGTTVGYRAVRWDASGAAATELDNLGTDFNGITNCFAYSVNGDGTAVGSANKYTGGTGLGTRAVRWDASGTAATELGNLGTDSSGFTGSFAYAINVAGAAVGYAQKYTGGAYVGDRAVLWNPDGVAVDLNTLIDPASGWTLTSADAISDTNWVSGIGNFDPDGAGPLAAYQRAFLIDVSSAVPEPGVLGLLACGSILLIVGRRRNRGMGGLEGSRSRCVNLLLASPSTSHSARRTRTDYRETP